MKANSQNAGGRLKADRPERDLHAGVVMSVTPRRRHQRGQPVEQSERGERELGLAGGQRPGQAIADGLVGPVPGEPFTGEGGSGAVAQQPFEPGAIGGCDAHSGVQRKAAAMTPPGEVGGDVRDQGAMVHRETQDPAADLLLHGAHGSGIRLGGGVEARRTPGIDSEYAVGEAAVQVGVRVE